MLYYFFFKYLDFGTFWVFCEGYFGILTEGLEVNFCIPELTGPGGTRFYLLLDIGLLVLDLTAVFDVLLVDDNIFFSLLGFFVTPILLLLELLLII